MKLDSNIYMYIYWPYNFITYTSSISADSCAHAYLELPSSRRRDNIPTAKSHQSIFLEDLVECLFHIIIKYIFHLDFSVYVLRAQTGSV